MKFKKSAQDIISNSGLKGFGFLYILFLCIGLVLLFLIKHGDIVLLINQYSREEWDFYINLATNLGLGSVLVIAMLLLGFSKIRYTLMGLLNLAIVGLTSNLFKNFLFPYRNRPFGFFSHDDFSRYISIADSNFYQSFPSGHTMAFFAIAFLMAYFTRKKWLGILFFSLALLIGFTRIYLCQHFFLDVYVGSILGVITSFLTIWIGDYLLILSKRTLFQKSIINIIKETRIADQNTRLSDIRG